MSIIKERIKLNNSTGATITFGLSGNNRFSGYQQEIDELTENTKQELINPIIDHEVRRYSHVSGEGQIFLNFYFGSSSPQISFINAGFTNSEIDSRDKKLLNSFFILDFYDKYDPYTQTKIFSTYLTKVLDGELQAGKPTPYYIISDKTSQYYHWYVPESFIEAQTGTTIAYVRFSFYNAKTGKLSLFYNKDNDGLTTPKKMYFETTLNLTNMTWQINLSSLYARAYEISSTNGYVNKVNDAIKNFDNQQQVYPTGNIFQSEDGTYTTV